MPIVTGAADLAFDRDKIGPTVYESRRELVSDGNLSNDKKS
jgi:hypothetical protein